MGVTGIYTFATKMLYNDASEKGMYNVSYTECCSESYRTHDKLMQTEKDTKRSTC